MYSIQVALIAILTLGLTACASFHKSPNKTNSKHAVKVVAPVVVPKDLDSSKIVNYYPVQKLDTKGNTEITSIAPPDTNLKPATEVRMSKVSVSLDAKSNKIIVDQKIAEAWVTIGRALKEAGYRIMEEDKAMNTYFVLDSKQTNDKIQKDTPIYQVQLKENGKSTDINMLNEQNEPVDSATNNRFYAILENLTA